MEAVLTCSPTPGRELDELEIEIHDEHTRITAKLDVEAVARLVDILTSWLLVRQE
jgi:hypothetical protein